jgi:hypothetical protein
METYLCADLKSKTFEIVKVARVYVNRTHSQTETEKAAVNKYALHTGIHVALAIRVSDNLKETV